MKSFQYAAPSTLAEATALLGDTWGQTEIMAGGTDLVTSLKQRLTQPERVVSLRNIKELKGVSTERKEIRVGAMTTLGEFAENQDVRQHFPSLVTAIEGIGSAQLLSTGTVGGDLCQRPRCWFPACRCRSAVQIQGPMPSRRRRRPRKCPPLRRFPPAPSPMKSRARASTRPIARL